jgi:predicted ATPase
MDEAGMTRPQIKLTRLYIKELKAIREFSLPEDGLGWDGEIPDVMVIGGANGSGKTTLLSMLASIAPFASSGDIGELFQRQAELTAPRHAELTATILVSVDDGRRWSVPVIVGQEAFVAANSVAGSPMWTPLPAQACSFFAGHEVVKEIQPIFRDERARARFPAVLYFPSEQRDLVLPKTSQKSFSKQKEALQNAYRWTPEKHWQQSLEARLYAARWEDLNAKEEGRPEDAVHFKAYADEFSRFFEDQKALVWRKAELVVETRDGAIHDLTELSSGEKQMIVLMAELHRLWRPGSLVLIDEPELHLHPAWQTKLLTRLEELQAERGGQVILATQSAHLFRIAKPGTTVLLGREAL